MAFLALSRSKNLGAILSANRLRHRATIGPVPIYQQVLPWMLLWPLLNMTAKGAMSLFRPAGSSLNSQNSYLVNTAQGIRIPVVMNIAILLVFAVMGYRYHRRVLTDNPLIPLGILFAAVSSLWSESPFTTLRMSIELILSTLFATYLSARFSATRLMKLTLFVGVVAASLSLFLALFLHPYGAPDGLTGPWRGICNHKNALGLGMAFLLTPIFYSVHRKGVKLAYCSLLLFLVVMSQSRGAWFETAGTLAFVGWLVFFRRLERSGALLMTLAVALGVALVSAIALGQADHILRFIGKDPSLTGRTQIYAAVMESIAKHPLLGYGYGAFWWGFNRESFNLSVRIHWMSIGYAENGPLELALQLGWLGTSLVAIMVGRAFVQGVRLLRSPFYTPEVGWFLTILALEVLSNIDSGWLMASNSLDWTMTLIACIGLAHSSRRATSLQSGVDLWDHEYANSASGRLNTAPVSAA